MYYIQFSVILHVCVSQFAQTKHIDTLSQMKNESRWHSNYAYMNK